MSRKRSFSSLFTSTSTSDRVAGLGDDSGRERPLDYKRLRLDTNISDIRTQLPTDHLSPIDVELSPTEISSPFPSAYSSRHFLTDQPTSIEDEDPDVTFRSPRSFSTPLRRRPLDLSTSAEGQSRHFLEYGRDWSSDDGSLVLNEVSPSPAPVRRSSTPPPQSHLPPSYDDALHRLVRIMSLNPLRGRAHRYRTPSPSPASSPFTLHTPISSGRIRLSTPGAPARPSRQWCSASARDNLPSSPVILHECPDRPDEGDSPSYPRMPLYQRIDQPPTPYQTEAVPFESHMLSGNADRLCSEPQDADGEELVDPQSSSTRSPTAISIVSGKSISSLPASAMKKSKTARKTKNVRVATPARRRSQSAKMTDRHQPVEDALHRHRHQILQAQARLLGRND